MYLCVCGHVYPSALARDAHQKDCEVHTLPVLRRKYHFELMIDADNWPRVEAQLREYHLRLCEVKAPDKTSILSVTGGYDMGSHMEVHVEPEMTNEKFFELLTQRRSLGGKDMEVL